MSPAEHEWLITNGLGGYASGTVGGAPTRRFHGWLIAALPPPAGRVMLLNALDDGGAVRGFRLELGLPVWECGAFERRALMPQGRNVTLVRWTAREALTLRVRFAFQIRPHEGRVAEEPRFEPVLAEGARCSVGPVRLRASRGGFSAVPHEVRRVRYAVEEERGYDHEGPLVTSCALEVPLAAGDEVTLEIAADDAPLPDGAWDAELARRRALIAGAPERLAALQLAADQFVIRKATGGATVIAGYHWFTDWGRDTMISLDGLCLRTGRLADAALILRTFAAHVRDGLIPNLFPEGESEGLYHTADATLWFFHALDRYTAVSGDGALVRELLPVLDSIVEHHLAGTRFGIGVDPADGLLRQGAEGYQLTWMDAKVDGWVVTPRRGKAVEINALFYNALCLYARWRGGDARVEALAARLRASFNARFWNDERGHLDDVVDPDDASLRPNQVFAISLPHPVLDEARWAPVLQTVRRELLTPRGLRSLGPREPAYQPRYAGALRARDAAYHQGTVWGWLIGPFVDAWRKAYPEDDWRALLDGFALDEFGLGTIAEIFDGDPPHTPRGCIAQAWSVAEVLRCLSG